MYEIRHVDLNAENISHWKSSEKIYYLNYGALIGKVNPSSEYYASVLNEKGTFIYTIQGHGIGKSEKHMKELVDLVSQIKADNERFNSCNTIYVNEKSKNA